MSDFIRGNQLLRSGKLEEAIAAYQSAIAQNSDFYLYHQKLGEALEQLGCCEDAVEAYQRSIELNSNSSFSYNSFGQILVKKGQFNEAIDMYRTAIKLNPSFHGFNYNLAKALITKNDFQNAIAELELCLDKNPQHYPSYNLIGDLLVQEKQEDKLIQLYKQGLLATRHNYTDHQKLIQKISTLGLDGENFFNDTFLKNLQVVSDFWESHQPVRKKNEWVLIECASPTGWGLYATGRNLIAAKYLQKLYGYRIAAWCRPYEVDTASWTKGAIDYQLKQVLISFGVEKFIIPNGDFGLNEHQKSQLENFSSEANSQNFKYLLQDFKCDDLHIGDLVYDLILKGTGLSTPIFDESIIAALESGCLAHNFWKNFLHSCQVKFFLSTHATVYHHGLISRLVATKKGVVCFINDIEPSTRRYETIDDLYNPEGFISEKLFLYFWNNYKYKSAAIGKDIVENTMGIKSYGGNSSYVTFAYSSDKKVYTHPEFCEQLNLDPSRPIVVIASHAFDDCPHCSHHRLFVDYYEWLVETLKICSQIDSINWIIKEHPSVVRGDYVVDKTAKELVNNEYSLCEHIHLAPDDISNLSLIDFCHAIVTVSGTIAHELACFGIPSILAGSSTYSECGFTNNPQSVDEYKALLYSIEQQEKLTDEKIEKAHVAYAIQYYHKRCFATTNFILGYSNPYSAIESWVNRIKSDEIGAFEEDPFLKMFMIQILLKKECLLRFNELLDMD